MAKLSKTQQALVNKLLVEMEGFKPKQWATLHRQMEAEKAACEALEVHKAAYVAFMQDKSQQVTEASGGYYATLTPKKGQQYVAWEELLEDLAEEYGFSASEIRENYTRRRADTVAFSIKKAETL